MELNKILHELKYSKTYKSTSLTKEILISIRHVNKSQLIQILELLEDNMEVKFQVKLISILTAYLLFNNTNRDVIVQRRSLYDTLSAIFARGLPLKTTITLNFVTTLLYAEEEGDLRSRTLTMQAQNWIRSSGCLSAMTDLFTNYMLQSDTWNALCRCLVEVCRGSVLNQNFCSHLVPFCVQRCLQGNTDVLSLLQSLLSNHKRNINLFIEGDGESIFHRKDYLRLEACVQLLTTVIQIGGDEIITKLKKCCQIYKDLQDLSKMYSASSKIVQWTMIALYYLGPNIKRKDIGYNPTIYPKNLRDVDVNKNDTQMLLQNIMKEILSRSVKIVSDNPLKHLCDEQDPLLSISDMSRFVKDNQLDDKLNLKSSVEKNDFTLNSRAFCNEKLSFSFLKDEISQFDELSFDIRNIETPKLNRTSAKNLQSFQSTKKRDNRQFQDTFKLSFNNIPENIHNFKPKFVSTPKRLGSHVKQFISNKSIFTQRPIMNFGVNNKSKDRKHSIVKRSPKKSSVQREEKPNLKQRSMSSRLLEAINESCTTVIKNVKNIFIRKEASDHTSKQNSNFENNEDQKPYCSYSFRNYMHKREVELGERNTNRDASTVNTFSGDSMCHTCDDTVLLEQKLANDEHLKLTIKKLKLGINLYGCDFKRIAKNMWPRKTYMTPNVLYHLYRKLLLK